MTLFVLTACSEGENIPLSPPSVACERPLDSGWYGINNSCDEKIPRDAVWLDDFNAVVVGDKGLILESNAVGSWVKKDLGISEDLTLISANIAGDLVAAGKNGQVAVRFGGHWSAENSLLSANWNDVRANGEEVWLAGNNGALARGIPGQDWRMVDFPDTTDLLTVCAFGDSVFVGGRGGLFSVLVDNQWQDVAPAQWGEADIASMVRIPDGRLVVFSDSLMIRESGQWSNSYGNSYVYSLSGRLKFRDGILWFPRYNYKKIDLVYNEPVIGYPIYSGSLTDATPGPDGQILMLSNRGAITWHLRQDSQILKRVIDPSCALEMERLFRLNDGTVISPLQFGLVEITPGGIKPVADLSEEVLSKLYDSMSMGGNSLQDFYFSGNGYFYHCLNSQLVAQHELPANHSRIFEIKEDQSGKVFVVFRHALGTWNHGLWNILYENPEQTFNKPSFLTQYGTFVLQSGAMAMYYTNQGFVPIELEFGSIAISEREEGVLEFLESGGLPHYTWWEKGTGATATSWLDPIPGCPEVNMSVGCVVPEGVFVATRNHSMVLKLPENPNLGNWDLVAGPSEYQIRYLEVLPDGSLVARVYSTDFLMGYRPSAF